MNDKNQLPWVERVAMLSINPHAATIKDIARMAAELCHFYTDDRRDVDYHIPSGDIGKRSSG